jgi:hypothetical protein
VVILFVNINFYCKEIVKFMKNKPMLVVLTILASIPLSSAAGWGPWGGGGPWGPSYGPGPYHYGTPYNMGPYGSPYWGGYAPPQYAPPYHPGGYNNWAGNGYDAPPAWNRPMPPNFPPYADGPWGPAVGPDDGSFTNTPDMQNNAEASDAEMQKSLQESAARRKAFQEQVKARRAAMQARQAAWRKNMQEQMHRYTYPPAPIAPKATTTPNAEDDNSVQPADTAPKDTTADADITE